MKPQECLATFSSGFPKGSLSFVPKDSSTSDPFSSRPPYLLTQLVPL